MVTLFWNSSKRPAALQVARFAFESKLREQAIRHVWLLIPRAPNPFLAGLPPNPIYPRLSNRPGTGEKNILTATNLSAAPNSPVLRSDILIGHCLFQRASRSVSQAYL